jgi:hypothetical protein
MTIYRDPTRFHSFLSMKLPAKRRSRLWSAIPILSIGLIWLGATASSCPAQSRLDEPPIHYLQTRGDNPITRLFSKVDSGEISLRYEDGFGYLKSLLVAMDIPLSSQSLVFSKTSLQSARISPTNPRAIFFNDDVYVAWVRGSSLLEISTTDPFLGAAFYSVQMSPRRPFMRRENNRCLSCHESSTEQGKVPVHMIRSVMTRSSGKVNLLLDEFVTDHTSPITERWGGWYVTGDVGEMVHMGNSFLEGERLVPRGRRNPDDLIDAFDTKPWPSPHSDLVALMVLEHQTEMHNRLTRANYAVRRARHANDEVNDDPSETLEHVIENSAKLVVDHLLFVNEAKLASPVRGSTSFADDFAARGPRDQQGRSLREFDLQRRLFRYPCSYLIYSSAFETLDPQLLRGVYAKLWRVLNGQDQSKEYEHLSAPDRAAILEIVRQTKVGLPEDWTIPVTGSNGTTGL